MLFSVPGVEMAKPSAVLMHDEAQRITIAIQFNPEEILYEARVNRMRS